MKKLLVALMATVCFNADAATAAYYGNQAGGQIVLTDTQCTGQYSTMYVAYSSMPGKPTLWGCWFSDQVNIHIRWSDGDYRAYSLDAPWKFFPEVLRNMRRQGGV